MWMWIILASLIVILLVFMLITGIRDRKKIKKNKELEKQLKEKQYNYRFLVANWVLLVVNKNEKELKRFVPSIGSVKMSNIRKSSRKSLELLKTKEEFLIAKESEDNRDLIEHFTYLYRNNSNMWPVHNQDNITFFNKLAKEKAGDEDIKEFVKKSRKEIQGVYNEHCK